MWRPRGDTPYRFSVDFRHRTSNHPRIFVCFVYFVVQFTHFYTFYTVKIPNSKQLKTNLQADGRLLCKQNPPLSKIIHRSRDIADFPCPPSTEISAIISYFYVLLKVHLRNGVVQSSESNRKVGLSRWRQEAKKKKDRDHKWREKRKKKRDSFLPFIFQASGFKIHFAFGFWGEAFLMRRTVCLILPIKKFSSSDDSVSTVSRSGMMMSDNTSPKLCILFICTRLLGS